MGREGGKEEEGKGMTHGERQENGREGERRTEHEECPETKARKDVGTEESVFCESFKAVVGQT